MSTFRCTKRVLDYFQINPQEIDASSTAILDEWYLNIANTVLGDFLLYVSAPTKLTVVIPCGAVTDMSAVFYRSATALYKRLEFPDDFIADEARQMATAIFTKTKSRGVLGCMNDIVIHVRAWAEMAFDSADTSIEALEDSLSLVLHGPVPFKYPLKTVWSLIGERCPIENHEAKANRVKKRVWSEKTKMMPLYEKR